MREITQKNAEFSQHYADFQVIAADVDWNASALQNAVWMGWAEEMKDSFQYSDLPEELATFATVNLKWDNQIRPWRVEKAAHNQFGGRGIVSLPRCSARWKEPAWSPLEP